MKKKLFNIAICLHGVTTRARDRNTYIAYINDVKSQILYLKSIGYQFVNGAQYRSWVLGEWEPENPICCIMWDDARANSDNDANADMRHTEGIQLIMPWLIRNGISCCIPIITRRQHKYQPEQGFASWKMMKKWVLDSKGKIDVMTHTHNIHHLAVISEDGTAYAADSNPIFENPCWLDNGDYLWIRNADDPWYWDQYWTETAYAMPIWGVDQYEGRDLCKTTFHVTPRSSFSVKILRFWTALAHPSGGGYDIPIRIRANGVTAFEGVIKQKNYETRDQWAEREFMSITMQNPFNVVAGEMVALEFETLAGNEGAPLLSVYCLPVYHDEVPYAPGLTDDKFYGVSNIKGWRKAGTEGPPERSWQYIDWPPGDKWPVVPMMVLCDGTGRNATDAEYREYIGNDLRSTQYALENYMMANWRQLQAWEGDWESNPDFVYPFTKDNTEVFMPGTGLRLMGWYQDFNVYPVFPTQVEESVVVDGLRIWIGDVIPVGLPSSEWTAEIWEDHQNRNYNIVFDVQVSSDGVNWLKIGQSATWVAFRGQVLDIEPTQWTAGEIKYLRLYPVNKGISGDLPERECVYSIVRVLLMIKDNTKGDPTKSLCYPFGAFQNNYVDETPVKPEWHDVSRNIYSVFDEVGLDVAYTIQVLRNYLHNGDDIGYGLRLSNYVRGRLMLLGTSTLKETLNLLDAYSGNMFPDTQHNGTKWQVSLEGDLLGHGTVKRRINTVDYYAFDAWAFSGKHPIEIVKTSAPVNDGGYFPGFGDDHSGAGTYADEKSWIQARGGKALIIINNNLGTGSPDSEAGKHIFDNPDEYVAVMVRDAKEAGWDGITCNIEGVAVSGNDGADIRYRAQAVEFYRKLHHACRAAGLILHCTAPAATGNPNYDWIDWAGWCDHAEIIKYVDGMKLMSYTESFEWTMPRPAAWDVTPLMFYEDPSKPQDPRSFWNAVIDYAKNTIPDAYKRRIMLGARAFGHIWYPNWKGNNIPEDIQAVIDQANADGEYHPMSFWKYTDDERVSMYKQGTNEYMPYAEFINYCGTYALEVLQDLSQDTSEMYLYSARSEVMAWCGTPLTGARSMNAALKEGFGGVGIWKIDDGDIEEYYPEFKRFGLSNPMIPSYDMPVPETEEEREAVPRFKVIPGRKLKKIDF